ncbi:hypothetical protein BKA57DRAFT_114447 [Linnemannia elongata]|nr:hypothetical protein BKA57DRAFT_114447 [Linnemannia elongata]
MIKQRSFPQSSQSFTTLAFYSCNLILSDHTQDSLVLYFFHQKCRLNFLLFCLSLFLSLYFFPFCLLFFLFSLSSFLFCLPSFLSLLSSFFFFFVSLMLLSFLCHCLSQPIVLLPPSSLMNPHRSALLFCSPFFFPLPHLSLYCPPRYLSSRFLSHSYFCKKLLST